MEVRRYATAAEFLEATKVFRNLDPVRTGLITSIANSVANGSRHYEEYFWWAALEQNQIHGLAIRTVPYGYVFSPMPNGALEKLLSQISLVDSNAKEFAGPKNVIDFLEQISGMRTIESGSELIYENRHLIRSPAVGEVRMAVAADFEVIYDYSKHFIAETGLSEFNLEVIVRDTLSKGRYFVLSIDNAIVSFGGHTDFQFFDEITIARVGPIFTPKEHRKNGYASAVTSAITDRLIASGALPTLYTQATNPTSNKIYQELGYTLVAENRHIVFA